MNQRDQRAPFGRGQFNTLAQNGTGQTGKVPAIIQGTGSLLLNTKSSKARAKRKNVSQKVILGMIEAGSNNGKTDMQKAYWNTFHCQNLLKVNEARTFGQYCKNRFCTVCAANRKADILNRYMPVITTWPEPYFVTLTVKSVPAKRLGEVMRSMLRAFRAILAKYRKRAQRKKGGILIGIRSLECNFNPVQKTYNPHFHCVVATKEMGEILIGEWLERSNPGWTNKYCQKSFRVKKYAAALMEVVKYSSKLAIDPEMDKKAKVKNRAKVYAAALNNIFQAMKGLRIFDRFGFNLPPNVKPQRQPARVVYDYTEWVFDPGCGDWLNKENGNPLTNYIPPAELEHLLNNIDAQLE